MSLNGYNPNGNEPIFSRELGFVEDRLQGNIDNVSSQLADIATNVKSFGAKLNGTTDDTTAIQNAINSAPNGAVVIIPAGTTIVSSLYLKQGITLKGAGKGTTVIKQKPNTTANLINATDDTCVKWKLMDLTLDGNNSNGTNGMGLYINRQNPSVTYDTHAVVSNIEVLNCAQQGIETNLNSRGIYFNNVEVGFCGLAGFQIISSDNVFDSCISYNNGYTGFLFQGNSHIVNSCKAFTNGGQSPNDGSRARPGFYTINVHEIYFSNCYAQQNYGDGFYIQNGYGITLAGCGGSWNSISSISSGSAGTYKYAGLFIQNSTNITAKGFVANDPSYPQYGVRNQKYGVEISGSTYCDIDAVVTNIALGNELYVDDNVQENPSSLSYNTLRFNGQIVTKDNQRRAFYAEGTFTPVLGSSSGTPNHQYTVQSATWVLIGKLVTLNIRLNISGTGYDSAATGNVQIKNLPFTASNNPVSLTKVGTAKWKDVNLTTGYHEIKPTITAGNNYLEFYQYGGGVVEAPLTHNGNLTNWSNIALSITFTI